MFADLFREIANVSSETLFNMYHIMANTKNSNLSRLEKKHVIRVSTSSCGCTVTVKLCQHRLSRLIAMYYVNETYTEQISFVSF